MPPEGFKLAIPGSERPQTLVVDRSATKIVLQTALRIKSQRTGWAGHVVCTGEKKMHVRFWWETLKGKRPLGRQRGVMENAIEIGLKEI
jgi:hypothetical protein